MTLERFTVGGSTHVRLVECPFCEADLDDELPPNHLEQCEAFADALNVLPRAGRS